MSQNSQGSKPPTQVADVQGFSDFEAKPTEPLRIKVSLTIDEDRL